MRAAMSCTSIHENYQELVKESSPVKVGCCSRTGCCAGVSDVCEVVVALAEIDYPRAENPRKNRLLGKLVAQIDVHAKKRNFSAQQAAKVAGSLASLKVTGLDSQILTSLADSVLTFARDLDGISIALWLGAMAFFGQTDRRFIRELFAQEHAFASTKTPAQVFVDVVAAYGEVGKAFEIGPRSDPADLAVVTRFATLLKDRVGDLNTPQLLVLLEKLQSFPPEVFDAKSRIVDGKELTHGTEGRPRQVRLLCSANRPGVLLCALE
jgi:hypothetical protein